MVHGGGGQGATLGLLLLGSMCAHPRILSTQRVEGIDSWTKESRLNKSKSMNAIFHTLMVIIEELTLK